MCLKVLFFSVGHSVVYRCSVVCAGMEAQMLGTVVRKEKPELEEQKDRLVRGIAAGRRKLLDLESEILR